MAAVLPRATQSSPASGGPYRDGLDELIARRDHLLTAMSEQARALPRELTQVHAARVGRTCGGITAAVGAAGVVACAAWPLVDGSPAPVSPTEALVLAAAAGPLGYLFGWLIAPSLLERALVAELHAPRDLCEQLARLEHESIEDRAARRIDDLEARAIAWPLIAIALLTPLSLHLVVWWLFGQQASLEETIRKFDGWIRLSLCVVGPAHLVLAALGWHQARQLHAWRDGRPREFGDGWHAWAYTSVASLVPGAVLLLIPPVLVTVTGLAFIPLTFWWMRRRMERERALVGVVEPGSPRL